MNNLSQSKNYRTFFNQINRDRINIEKQKQELIRSGQIFSVLDLHAQSQALIGLQDKLLTYIALLESKSLSAIKTELEFSYT